MKKQLFLLLSSAVLVLSACNSGGGTTTSDVQNASISNGTANIAIQAIGCRTIAANGGSCTVNINYSAPANSPVLQNNTFLAISGLNNYTNNIQTQCSSGAGYFSTYNKTCSVTITSTSSTSSSQSAQIYPAGFQNPSTIVTFSVGGGI